MISGVQSALSALQAYGVKMQNTGNNVANMNTEEFKKGRVLLQQEPAGGVSTSIGRVDEPGPLVAEQTTQDYEMIEQSNVDLGQEIPDMMLTANAYKANLKTLQVGDEMTRTLLDIKG